METLKKYGKENLLEIIGILLCVILAAIGIDIIPSNLSFIPVCMIIILFLIGSYEKDLGLLFLFLPFNSLFLFSGTSIRGVIYLITAIKILKNFMNDKVNKKIIIIAAIWIGIELCNEIIASQYTSMLNILCGMIFFAILVLYCDLSKLDFSRITYMLLIGLSIALIMSLVAGGGLSAYNNDIEYYRFGQEAVSLGGPMEIPVYCGMIIGISFYRFIYQKGNLLLNSIMIIIALLLGLLTVSRVFILILIPIIICVVMWQFKLRNRFVLKFDLAILAGIGVVYSIYRSLINKVISKFLYRFIATDSSRSLIYLSTLNYIFSHPKTLLIGEGCIAYPIIGQKLNMDFGMMTHNLLLDGFMSWGIIGLLCFSILVVYFFRKNISLKKIDIFSLLPLFIYIFSTITGGSFNYFTQYLYIIFTIAFISQNQGNKLIGDQNE